MTVNFALPTELTPEQVEGKCLIYMVAGPGDALDAMRRVAAAQLAFAEAERAREDRPAAREAVADAAAILDAFVHADAQGPFPRVKKETLQ